MARYSVTYMWNGGTSEYMFSGTHTPEEIQDIIKEIFKAMFVHVPSDTVVPGDVDAHRCVYLVPVSSVVRFSVYLEPGEVCPDPNVSI